MKAKDILKVFNDTGNCEIDVDVVVKSWDNKRSAITSWKDEEFTLFKKDLRSRNSYIFKLKIPKHQALEIIDKLKLEMFQDTIFRSGKTYFKK